MSINVSLPKELEDRVREHVASGLYGSASEVIREALRLFEACHLAKRAHLSALKADIDCGIADVRAGRVAPVSLVEIEMQGRRRR